MKLEVKQLLGEVLMVGALWGLRREGEFRAVSRLNSCGGPGGVFRSDDGLSSSNLRKVTFPLAPGKGKLFRLLRIPFLGTLSIISFELQ